MTAIGYLLEKKRMGKASQDGYCSMSCSACPLGKKNNGTKCECHQLERLNPERAIEIVEGWAKDHPLKTYAQDFFEKFPNAPKDVRGKPLTCRWNIYGGSCRPEYGHNCAVCWDEPMNE